MENFNHIDIGMERKKITFDSFIRGILVAVVVIGILWLFKRLSSVLLPFFVAWLIAYLIYPLVTFFQHRLRLKNRAVSICCALFSILLVGGVASGVCPGQGFAGGVFLLWQPGKQHPAVALGVLARPC